MVTKVKKQSQIVNEFATVADMIAGVDINGNTVDFEYLASREATVKTKWHNTNSKEGGAEYEIITDTERAVRGLTVDEANIITLPNSTFAVIDELIINMYQLGALGDGVTSDESIFEKANNITTQYVFVPTPLSSYLFDGVVDFSSGYKFYSLGSVILTGSNPTKPTIIDSLS